MLFNPAKLRGWLLSSAVLIVAVVLGFYSYARWRMRSVAQALPGKLGIQVERSTQGFSFSKSESGRTIFTIHAGKAVEFKQGGRSALHDVNIIVYGKESNRFDQIYGSDFEYDPGSGNVVARGEVQMDLQNNAQGPMQSDQTPPQELKNLIHLKTSGLVFNQRTGIAVTQERIEFRLPQANGSAMGATLDSKTGALTLSSDVMFNTSGADPATITAQHAVLTKSPRQAALDVAKVVQEGRSFDTPQMTIFLRDDNTLDHMVASGGAHGEGITNTEKTAERYDLHSAGADFRFSARNQIQSAIFNGGVTLDSRGSQIAHGTAETAIADFGPGQQLRKIHAVKNVRLEQMQNPASGKNGQNLQLIADGMDIFAGPNGIFERAVTSGAARIEIQSPPDSIGKPSAKTVITAGQFIAKFDVRGNIKTLHGEPDARIVSPSPTPGKPDRISASRTLDASFAPGGQGGIENIIQRDDVHFSDPPRQAFAQNARYTPANRMLILTGSPRVQDDRLSTTAQTIRMDRQNGNAYAEGDVKSTYNNLQPQPNGATKASDPVHVAAANMVAFQSTGIAHYTGNVRLWQVGNVVQAPVIDFQHDHHSVVANGSARTPVKSVFVQADKKGRQTPVNVTSSRLTYSDDQSKAQFEGHVIMASAEGVITADRLNLYLQARNASAAKQNAGGKQIERAVAEGNVTLQQPSRKGTGEKLVYTAADGRFLLTGTPFDPPKITDAQRGAVTGDSITFFNGEDRVLVESAGEVRAVTQARVK